MIRSVVVGVMCGIGFVGCVPGGVTTCIPDGTVVALGRTNPTGACPADVTAGIALLNQTITLAKGGACGVTHFKVTATFTDQAGSGSMCQSSDAISFQDLTADGADGTDVMTITCANGISCVETYDATFTPQ